MFPVKSIVWRRVALAVGLGCLLVVVVRSCFWSAGPGEEDNRPETHLAAARKGVPVVAALYRYRNDHGLWPLSLQELVPDYATAEDCDGWGFRWRPQGDWRLMSTRGMPGWRVSFSPKPQPGWDVTVGGIDVIPLAVEQPLPPRRDPPVGPRRQELLRRIAADPRRISHYQGLMGDYVRAGDWSAARDLCLRARAARPDHWWPHLMLADIDLRRGEAELARETLRGWLAAADGFPRRVVVAELLWRHRRLDDARGELAAASKFPLDSLGPSDDAEEMVKMGVGFAWHGSVIAYSEGWYDLARAICDRWEEYDVQENRTASPGYYLIRAACFLALGDCRAAGEVSADLHRRMRGNYSWREIHADLDRAVAERRPGKLPSLTIDGEILPLLIDYE